MHADLFAQVIDDDDQVLGEQARVLRGFAILQAEALLSAVDEVVAIAPFRQLRTPSGLMSVAMSNCGERGWCSDACGYRYSATDPDSGRAWPAMPLSLRDLACRAAQAAGFPDYRPDACLINRYRPGTRMGLHQDRDEGDKIAPIVSVSLGIPATFLFGGLKRNDAIRRIEVRHGDVAVWGGVDRLRYHGVATVKRAVHPLLGDQRINLTFRKTR
ncbi:DNA oxidative demethylase AlkB [Pseudoxanthomonas kalamensis DSM 18571]|uniref:DNA oxidative demethylase AlkB n=1 Tax=Pseudoxanthomonas kalamensis TaxID=289483 RepID=UPI001391C5DC|nr:DNA oxidative demethylase AlkB [Pseudoxanthomonas kalamensis]KAF1712538.1 DNA oxidative demethylase AlkB [Pseudoxanthomonas kalamensis DSM 18571]